MHRTELSHSGDAVTVARAVSILRGLRYFGELADPLLARLVRRGTLVELDRGEVLIREGDPTAQEMYVLIDGKFLVESKSQLILTLERPGDVVGELAVLQAPPRTADVLAGAPTRALAIRPDVVALPEFADVAAVFYMMLSHSLAYKLRATTAHSRQQIDRVEREAATDPLTGLANRKRLDDVLGRLRAHADGGGRTFSLIMADVDHFKQYNDSNGHVMGDIVLVKVGMILQTHIRHGDVAARYGGEEFVLVLPDCDGAAAVRVAETLRAAIERETFPNADRQPLGRLTATFGVATYVPGTDAGALLQEADAALYRGKAAGRNRVASGKAPAARLIA